MKILITGSNGYVGSALYKALMERYITFPMTRLDADLTKSVQVNRYFKNKDFDVVIHCAGEGGSRLKRDDQSTIDNILTMYYNLLSNKESFKRFINIGSGAEIYAKNTPYGLAKSIIRDSCYHNGFNMARVFGVFDENELDTRFIKASILKAKRGLEPEIIGDRYFDFMYMPDFISIIDKMIKGETPQEIDAVYKKRHKMSEVAAYITKIKPHIRTGYQSNYIGHYTELGIGYIGLEQGIKEVYARVNDSNRTMEHRS